VKRYSVAVDFDGVIHSYTSPWVAPEHIPDPPVEGAIEWLNEIQKDFDLVIFTTRGSTTEGRAAVREYLYAHGFVQAGEHEDELYRITLPVVTAEKHAALVYVDDRAYRFEGPGTFPTTQQIYAAKPWNKRS
jgi:hypothetical protein